MIWKSGHVVADASFRPTRPTRVSYLTKREREKKNIIKKSITRCADPEM